MQEKRHKYTKEFYLLCNNYINSGHSLMDTALYFNINYTTLRQNLILLGFRKPNKIGKINEESKFNENYFDNIDTHAKAYFLGLLMSDGYICSTAYSNRIGIALQSCDKYILDIFKNELQLETLISNYKNSYKLVLCGSSHMYDILKSYGVEENKSHKDYIIPNIPNEFFNSFVRGYFDGDGCISIKSTGYSVTSICCNSEKFLNSLLLKLKELIPELLTARVKCEIGSRKAPLYVLYITKMSDQKLFRDFIYQNDNIKLIRKYNKFEKIPC